MAREPKYFIGEQGFTNKREYNNALAANCLSKSGIAKLGSLIEKAIYRIVDKMGVDEEKAAKMVHIGFRNSQFKKLNQTLQLTVDALTEKGYVEMVAYSHTAGGGVVANGRIVLLRKDFNEVGQAILTDNVVDTTKEEREEMRASIPAAPPEESTVEFIITDDINVTDSFTK